MAPSLRLKPIDTKKLSERFRRMAKELPNAVDEALLKAAEDMLDDAYQPTVDSWDHAVEFDIVGDAKSGYRVTTDDEVWQMLEHGTRAHIIEASAPDKPLSFYAEYQAKTRVGQLSSSAGGASGDRVYAQVVQHPGTKARKWHDAAYKRWAPRVVKYIRDALRAGTEAVGL